MHSIFKFFSIFSILLLASCSGQMSLQEYFVAHQEDADFITADIPLSLLDLADKVGEVSAQEKEAFSRIRKINFLALPIQKTTEARLAAEKQQLKAILSDDAYETLMRFTISGSNVVISTKGSGDAIDEVIIWGADATRGIAVARVLGDDIQPEHIATLAQAAQQKGGPLSGLENIIQNL